MPAGASATQGEFVAAFRSVGRRATATRVLRAIIGVTAFLGVAVPIVMVAGDPANRTSPRSAPRPWA